ncbi:MAG: hypothetical protein HZB29_08860 [Nitrospinae bacterium]|nr:hypothetical protein [Nitrospinota bacterium]
MKKSLFVIVTKTAEALPVETARIALDSADRVTLIQDGVYNTPERFAARGFAVDASKWSALDDDVQARSIATVFELTSYDGIVEDIEKHHRTVVL